MDKVKAVIPCLACLHISRKPAKFKASWITRFSPFEMKSTVYARLEHLRATNRLPLTKAYHPLTVHAYICIPLNPWLSQVIREVTTTL